MEKAALRGDEITGNTKASQRSRTSSSFESLPESLLVYIASLLDRPTDLCSLSICSRYLNSICWASFLWTSLTLSPSENANKALKVVTGKLCLETPLTCLNLEQISLNNNQRFSDDGAACIANYCSQLRKFEMSNCQFVSHCGIKSIIQRCTNLEYLDMSSSKGVRALILPENFSPVNSKNLEVDAITSGSQCSVRRNPNAWCLSLIHLDISDCGLNDRVLVSIVSQTALLQNLYLRRNPELTDNGLKWVGAKCPRLKEISVCECQQITNHGIEFLVERLNSNLKYLSMAKCFLVTDKAIKYIALHCPKLRYLNIRGLNQLSDKSMDYLSRCQRLRSLDISKCYLITDAGITVVALNCSALRRLSIRGCSKLTDKSLLTLAKCCPLLQHLNIQECCFSVEAYKKFISACHNCATEHTNPYYF